MTVTSIHGQEVRALEVTVDDAPRMVLVESSNTKACVEEKLQPLGPGQVPATAISLTKFSLADYNGVDALSSIAELRSLNVCMHS